MSSAYYYLYLTGEVGVQIDFNLSSLDTAMEAGGPMRSGRPHGSGQVIEGQDPASQLPNSDGQMFSALGRELSDQSPYAKSHAERTKGGSGDSVDEKV